MHRPSILHIAMQRAHFVAFMEGKYRYIPSSVPRLIVAAIETLMRFLRDVRLCNRCRE
jgi:hypothetical protein